MDFNAIERFEPSIFCLSCNAALYEKGQAACYECGLQYDTSRPETYRTEPMFLRWKFWFPGFCLALVSGVLSYAICLTSGELGLALFVAVPISFGAILGYATRAYIWLLGLLLLVLIGSVVLGLMALDVAGFFCGLTLGFVFILPGAFGIILGLILRSIMQASRWDQRWFFPLVFFVLLPYIGQAIESQLPRRREIATVRTALSVHATPQEAWDAVMFYEEVAHSPPWLLRLALPKPVRSVGDKTREGEVVRCFYDRGHLSKRISRVEPQRRLSFVVVQQQLHFERDIRLLDGSFQLQPQPDGRTSIVLTTRYERQLSPRWLWEPIERRVVHTLHEHVLEGMRREAEPIVEPYQPVEQPRRLATKP